MLKVNPQTFALPILLLALQVFSLALSAQPPASTTGSRVAQFFQAIRSGDSLQLERQLAAGANPNDTLHGFSALMTATLSGTTAQMKRLIDRGAKVNYADKDGITALWLALPDRDKTVLLLDRGADARMMSREGYSSLVKLANMPGTVDLFRLLIDKGADPRKSGPDNSLLYNAAGTGDTAIVGLLLRSGVGVNDTVSFGDYPISASLTYRQFSTLKMLVDAGAFLNVQPMKMPLRNLNGFTPLMWAAVVDDERSFYYLLDHGADPNLRNQRGYTALMLLQMSEGENPDMTLALIQHGASATVRAQDGSDALSLARKKGNTRSVELLKKYVP